jgi:pimeloyl-ACP methyl ester carboxylesterase
VERWPAPATLPAPALAVLSSRSSFTDAERARQAVAALPDCEVIEMDAVHWIPTEQPEAMRTAIEDWLARRVPGKAP